MPADSRCTPRHHANNTSARMRIDAPCPGASKTWMGQEEGTSALLSTTRPSTTRNNAGAVADRVQEEDLLPDFIRKLVVAPSGRGGQLGERFGGGRSLAATARNLCRDHFLQDAAHEVIVKTSADDTRRARVLPERRACGLLCSSFTTAGRTMSGCVECKNRSHSSMHSAKALASSPCLHKDAHKFEVTTTCLRKPSSTSFCGDAALSTAFSFSTAFNKSCIHRWVRFLSAPKSFTLERS